MVSTSCWGLDPCEQASILTERLLGLGFWELNGDVAQTNTHCQSMCVLLTDRRLSCKFYAFIFDHFPFFPIFLGVGHVLSNTSSIAVRGVGKNPPLVLEELKIPWLEQVPQSWWRVRITKTG